MIIEILNKEKAGLTVKQLAEKTGLTPPQVRNIVSSKFDSPIVYTGGMKYNLVGRVLGSNFTFRYHPSELEITNRNLIADDDLETLLEWHNFWEPIRLTDRDGREYRIIRAKPSKDIEYPHYRGLAAFFRHYPVYPGDDLLFTVINFENHEFRIRCLSARERNEKEIRASNRKLAELVYDILVHLPWRQDSIIFFARRLLPLLVDVTPPPDNLVKALEGDPRFIVFSSHELKNTLVALSKYTVVFHPDRPSPVYIEKDEYGRYGFCGSCGLTLTWSPEHGWRHPKSDETRHKLYREEAELDKRFFQQD